MIGSTSWVVPGTYIENARILEGIVDFVELLVYTWDEDTKRLLHKEMPCLLDLDLSYTIHLPTDNLEHVHKAIKFIEDAKFPVLNYVLHPLEGWEKHSWSDRVSIENLIDRIEPYKRMVFDVGHHILGVSFPNSLKDNIVEIHAMGVEKGRDHLSLNKKTADVIKDYMIDEILINFEVFDIEDLKDSIKLWRDILDK
ncbi:MAG: hypothetical protein DRP50_00255 [Thermotoga sp.]|nr:MAG: hypothetical protein DRP50_00255 [Thermotoga sp.]